MGQLKTTPLYYTFLFITGIDYSVYLIYDFENIKIV